MDKKSIIMGIIIILLIIIIGLLLFNGFQETNTSENTIKIGNATFTLPEDYHKDNNTTTKDTKITNGVSVLFITEYNRNNATAVVNEYKEYVSNENNYELPISEFNVNNFTVYKSENNKTGSLHYWFDYNGKVYCMYTSGGSNHNIDELVFDMIKSIDNN